MATIMDPDDLDEGGDLEDLTGVEVAIIEGSKEGSDHVITMRDAKDPNSPTLVFTPAEWDAFVAGVKDGEFDLDDEDFGEDEAELDDE
jgi:hypothetical protein